MFRNRSWPKVSQLITPHSRLVAEEFLFSDMTSFVICPKPNCSHSSLMHMHFCLIILSFLFFDFAHTQLLTVMASTPLSFRTITSFSCTIAAHPLQTNLTPLSFFECSNKQTFLVFLFLACKPKFPFLLPALTNQSFHPLFFLHLRANNLLSAFPPFCASILNTCNLMHQKFSPVSSTNCF